MPWGGSLSLDLQPQSTHLGLGLRYHRQLTPQLALGPLLSVGHSGLTREVSNPYPYQIWEVALGGSVRNRLFARGDFRAWLQSGLTYGVTTLRTSDPTLDPENQSGISGQTLSARTSLLLTYDLRRLRLLGYFGNLGVSHRFAREATRTQAGTDGQTNFGLSASTGFNLGAEFLF